ncbi:MAG TPA: hypothetical protein VE597_03245 [Geminicoccaceae bacterium]|jgi:hypothetical protein|nr:hypothetical protein [Geminicoccaceae bacterium]
MRGRILLRAIRAVLTVRSVPACSSPLFENADVDEDYVSPTLAHIHALPAGYVALTIERKVAADEPIALSVANEQNPRS